MCYSLFLFYLLQKKNQIYFFLLMSEDLEYNTE